MVWQWGHHWALFLLIFLWDIMNKSGYNHLKNVNYFYTVGMWMISFVFLTVNLMLINFLFFLNQRHPKIKFTIEKQTENQLSFLDLLITSNGNNFQTSVYRKNDSIGLYTNYLSCMPFSYKMGLVKTLLHRAFVISSNWSNFHLELSKTKELLEKNLYPSNFIDQQIKQ